MKKEIKLYFNSANSTWRYRYRKDGNVKDFYSANPNERKALAEIKQKVARFELGATTTGKITVGAVIDEYLADCAKRVSSGTLKGMKSRAKNLDTIKNIYISDMKKIDWQRLLDTAVDERNLSLGMARHIKGSIVAICKYAARCGYISDYDVPLFFELTGRPKKEKKALTPEQLKRLFEPSDDWYIHAFRFLVLTGLRRGELCALLLDRDYDGASIHVRESLTPCGERTTGKTRQAQRTIYLSQAAMAEINAHLARRSAKGLISEALFCNTRGGGLSASLIDISWRCTRMRLGIDLSLHELRHTHITYTATKSGIDLADLKKIYGHSKSMNTVAIYIHDIEPSEAEKLKEIEKLKAMAAEIEKSLLKR